MAGECSPLRSLRRWWRPLSLALSLLPVGIAPTVATGGGCLPQRLVSLPVRAVAGVPIVTLTVRGKETALIIDTGAEFTLLSRAAADRLGLGPATGQRRRMQGVDGGVASAGVDLPGLAAAGVPLPNFGATVGAIDLPPVGDVRPDGVLGADILSSFDLDLDLVRNRLDLYNRPRCPPSAPPWNQPYALIEANRSLHDRLFFQVAVDGRTLAALFDTGAQRSVLDTRAALKLGASKQALARDPTMGLHGIAATSKVSGHLHRFRQLVIGGESLADPAFVVAPLDLADADLVLGIDYLKDHRLWLSYGSHRIFLGRR